MAKSLHLFRKYFVQTYAPTTLGYILVSKVLILVLQLRKLVRGGRRNRLRTFEHQICEFG